MLADGTLSLIKASALLWAAALDSPMIAVVPTSRIRVSYILGYLLLHLKSGILPDIDQYYTLALNL